MKYILVYFFCIAGVIETWDKEVYIVGKERKKYMYEMFLVPGTYRYISSRQDTVYFNVYENEEIIQLNKSKDFRIIKEKTLK